MEKQQIEEIFKDRNLKRTKLRIALLDCFIKTKHGLSYSDLKKLLGGSVDKSTLYRNLAAFEESGIIHHINDHSGISKYAFGKNANHGTNHAHFVCEKCETVYCIEKQFPNQIRVPQGFRTNNVQTIIRGVCASC